MDRYNILTVTRSVYEFADYWRVNDGLLKFYQMRENENDQLIATYVLRNVIGWAKDKEGKAE